MLSRRLFACALALPVLLSGAPGATAQESYPNRPLRLVVPYGPGGGTDIIARFISMKMGEGLGQQVVVENRGGGGTIIGTQHVARSAPDGYTILLGTNTLAVNESLYEKRPYDLRKDLVPVTLLAAAPNVLVVNPAFPVNGIQDLIAKAKAEPGKINYSSSGLGGTGHLSMELLKNLAGINLVHVPYKSGGPALTAVISGEMPLIFNQMVSVMQAVRNGQLRAIAITSAERSPAAPDIPTVAEQGVPGFEATAWFGMFVPAGTPQPIVARLDGEFQRILKLPDIQDNLSKQGADIVAKGPAEFAKVVSEDIERWGRVIKAAGIKAE